MGGNGININGAGINVTLRGLTIYGTDTPGQPNPIGINITAAAVVRIEHCKIYGFTTAGVEVQPGAGNIAVKIQDSVITHNAGGILVQPSGSANVVMSVERSQIENNTGGGLRANSTNGPINADISDSNISENGSNGLNISSGTGVQNDIVSITRSTIANNGLVGIQAGGSNGAVLLDTTLLDSNASGATDALNGGRILTYGNNRIVGSAGSGFTGSATLQ